jgi:hypothetical protein
VLPDAIRPELLALQRPGAMCPEALLPARACPASSQVGTARAVTPILPEPLTGPVYVVQQAANPLPKLAVFLDGIVSLRLDAQNEIQHVQIVNTFNGVPDVPLTSFELKINGGARGILKNFSSLCAKELRGQVTFTAHSGKTFSDKPAVDVPGCESASAAPRASVSLRGVRSGSPVLRVNVRRAPGGAKLRSLRIALPRGLRARGRMARAHGRVAVKKAPRAGVASIRVVLRNGALRPAASLRARAGARRLKFDLQVTDAAKHRFTISRKVRPRS